jgi:hypothetical protein
MNRFTLGICAASALALGGCIGSGEGKDPAAASTPAPSPAETLAQLDRKFGDAEDYENILEALDALYPESPREIADMTVVAWQETGKKCSLWTILEAMKRSGKANKTPKTYAEDSASWATMNQQK